MDKLAELYTDQILHNPMFRLAEHYDYDAQNAYSVLGYILTMELCLSGGITEATPKPGAEGNIQPVTGPSARAWEAWIKDGQSIVFKTLLALDKSLMHSLVPTFSNQGELDWNDFGKLYAPVTKIITSSDLGEKLIWPNVQDAIGSVLAAYNSAVCRLDPKVDAGVRNVAARVNSADANSAVAALNAAVIGVDVYLSFESDVRATHYEGMAAAMGGMEAGLAVTPRLKYRIVLPRFDSSRAAYRWQLSVKRYSGKQVLASGGHRDGVPKSDEMLTRFRRLDYVPESTHPNIAEKEIAAADGSKTNFLIIEGNIELSIVNDIDAAKVFVEYFPHVHDAEMMANMEVVGVN